MFILTYAKVNHMSKHIMFNHKNPHMNHMYVMYAKICHESIFEDQKI